MKYSFFGAGVVPVLVMVAGQLTGVTEAARVVPTTTDCADIPGIAALWRMEGNGRDSVGGHDGFVLNTTLTPPSSSFTNGPFSCRALHVNGNGGGMFVPQADDLEFGEDEDLSMAAWVRIDPSVSGPEPSPFPGLNPRGNMMIIDKRQILPTRPGDAGYPNEQAIGYTFALVRNGGDFPGQNYFLECQLADRSLTNEVVNFSTSPAINVTDNRWHHVAVSVVRTSTNGGNFYFDGRRVGTFDPTSRRGDLANGQQLRVGLHANQFDRHFIGSLDDVSVYRRALSEPELDRLYRSGLKAECCRNVGVALTNAPVVNVTEPFDVRVRATRTFGKPPVGIVITNPIPPGLVLIDALPLHGTVTTNANQVIWNVGSFDTADESYSLRLRFRAELATNFVLSAVIGYTGAPDDEPADDRVTGIVESTGIPPCHPVEGLLGWWPGNTSPQDLISTNRGVEGGSLGYDRGVVRSGFQFDGSSSTVKLGDPIAFHVQDFTVEAWVRRGSDTRATATGSGGFFFAGDTGGYGFGMLDDGRLMLSQVGLSLVSSTKAITNTLEWRHVAVTKFENTVVFYIDGLPVTTTTMTGRFIFNRPFALGALGGQTRNVFLGGVDELALYGRPLNPAEIRGIVAAGAEGKCRLGLPSDERPDGAPDCVLKYTLEEGSPDAFVFQTAPDAELVLQTSTNLINWVEIRRTANGAGEIRGLINPTNSVLFYRVANCR